MVDYVVPSPEALASFSLAESTDDTSVALGVWGVNAFALLTAQPRPDV